MDSFLRAYAGELIVAGSTIIGAVAAALIQQRLQLVQKFQVWRTKRVARLEHATMLDHLQRNQRVYENLGALRRTTSAGRALLLAGHNSGGIPRPSSPFYTSVIASSIDDDHAEKMALIGQYKNLPVDATYIKLLLETVETPWVYLEVARMPECQLKRYYVTEGVAHSVLFFVGIKELRFYYISVAKYEDVQFTPSELTNMELLVNAIKGDL